MTDPKNDLSIAEAFGRQIGRTATYWFGLAFFLLAAWLRWRARDLVWPTTYSYSGLRDETAWAIQERALVEISWFGMALGVGLLLAEAWRRT